MQRTVLAPLVLIYSVSAAHAQFQMDLTYQQAREATGHLAVVDLAVGEVGILDYPSLCEKGGQLFTYRFDLLSETAFEYRTTNCIRRLPNNAVTLEAVERSQAAPGGLQNALQNAILTAAGRTCDRDSREDELFRVESINELTSASRYVGESMR